MTRARPSSLALVMTRAVTMGAALVACGSPELDPYCADYDDVTGRPVPLCRDLHELPVCDDAGEMARFERSGGTVQLIGGHAARCDDEREIVCDDPTATPYCLPELLD